MLSTINWSEIEASLNEKGYAVIPKHLQKEECTTLIGYYSDESRFRSTINMQRYRFGRGEYKYFKYPLPAIIQSLRENFYPALAHVANAWMRKLVIEENFPIAHSAMIDKCNAQQQLRPTPLILKYEAGGYNTLHQDLYGAVYFPFQVVCALTQVGRDHEGGEFVLVEQVPRAQSKTEVVRLNQGDAMIFTTNFRPVKGTRGFYRATMKHGVSEIKSGVRYSMGIIFHDAA